MRIEAIARKFQMGIVALAVVLPLMLVTTYVIGYGIYIHTLKFLRRVRLLKPLPAETKID